MDKKAIAKRNNMSVGFLDMLASAYKIAPSRYRRNLNSIMRRGDMCFVEYRKGDKRPVLHCPLPSTDEGDTVVAPDDIKTSDDFINWIRNYEF